MRVISRKSERASFDESERNDEFADKCAREMRARARAHSKRYFPLRLPRCVVIFPFFLLFFFSICTRLYCARGACSLLMNHGIVIRYVEYDITTNVTLRT